MTELRENSIPPPAVSLRQLRTDAGLTQKQLAEKVGVSAPLVCFWEQGTRSPDYDALPALCEIFGMDYNALVPCIRLTRNRSKR